MKPTKFTLSVLVLSFALLQSCELFFGSTTTTTTTLESVQLSSSAMVGSWTYDYVSIVESNDVEYTQTTTNTLTFRSDGTYLSSKTRVRQPTAGGAMVPVDFDDNKGVYTFDSDSFTVTAMEERYSTSPFPDTTSSWTNLPTPQSQMNMSIIAAGKLYTEGVYKSSELTSAFAEVWVRLTLSSGLYRKYVYVFHADGSAQRSDYYSSTTTFAAEPDNPPITFSYSVADDRVTFIFSAAQDTVHFAIFGSYLVLGGASGLGGWTKIE